MRRSCIATGLDALGQSDLVFFREQRILGDTPQIQPEGVRVGTLRTH